ncbi:Chitin synthase, class 2 [Aphanomyces cochlioides]|nr:Chitin synthase, class 2 [Aphanomyces cochlioides]
MTKIQNACFECVFFVMYSVTRSGVFVIRHGGFLFVAMASGLIAFCGGILIRCVVPRIATTTLGMLAYSGVVVFLLFNIMFNYIMCIVTDPGTVPIQRLDEEVEFNEDSDEDFVSLTAPPPIPRPQVTTAATTSYCRKCRNHRPSRAHHCSICDMCVDQMDHHCPWINNCVGVNNTRYFCSFLIWLTIACWFCSFLTYSPAIGSISKAELIKMAHVLSSSMLFLGPQASMYSIFLISTSAGLLVTFLCGWQIYLVLTAQTSIEYQINRSKATRRRRGGQILSPYSTGNAHENWEAVFGRCRYASRLCWLCKWHFA